MINRNKIRQNNYLPRLNINLIDITSYSKICVLIHLINCKLWTLHVKPTHDNLTVHWTWCCLPAPTTEHQHKSQTSHCPPSQPDTQGMRPGSDTGSQCTKLWSTPAKGKYSTYTRIYWIFKQPKLQRNNYEAYSQHLHFQLIYSYKVTTAIRTQQ